MNIKLTCNFCKKEYSVPSYKADKSKFCSDFCFRNKTYSKLLTENEIQLLLTGIFGDGCLNKSGKYHKYTTSCKFKEYILFKQSFLENLTYGACNEHLNKGYKVGKIFQFSTQSHPEISKIAEDSVENNLYKLNDLGVALWFFDDGSLHYKKLFYKLNTHKFSHSIHQDLFIPFFKKRYDIKATIGMDRKKDGRFFYYLRINKFDGAFIISNLLKEHNMKCYKYKIISSEAIS